MQLKKIMPMLCLLFLIGCGQPTYTDVTYLPTVAGKHRYSVSGIVMVPEFKKGVTKPYIEKIFTKTCPNGLRYIEFNEAINKDLGISVWVGWSAVFECK